MSISIFLLTVVALGIVPVLANAQVQHGAVVISNHSITVLGLDPFDHSVKPLVVNDTIKVITPSANCNKNASAHGEMPADGYLIPSKAITLDYENTSLECYVDFNPEDTGPPIWYKTQNWHEVMTPSGNVSLTCHFKDCNPLPSSCDLSSPDYSSCCDQNPYASGCIPK